MALGRPVIESKAFYRHIEQALSGLSHEISGERFARRFGPRALRALGPPMAVVALHLYRRDGAALALVERWGEGRGDLARELEERMRTPGERGIHELPWAGETGAGRVGLVAVDDAGPILALFCASPGDLRATPTRSELASAMASLQYAMRQHLHRGELENLIEQSRVIQMSLLPDGRPSFGAYDIAAMSVPAESVGGDLYDFIPIGDDRLALAVADASGHGLPAALQARDVITGLRMGVGPSHDIARTIRQLNRVIHRSGLVTRFVSMVYGELDVTGRLVYVNAGHPPPLLLDDAGPRPLAAGGLILGPDPEAAYEVGAASLEPGAALALYSDGVIERGTEAGEAFGEARLSAWLREWRDAPADRAVNDLLRRLREFGGGEAFEDDVTIMLVRRPR